jgi:hypothetical protein
VNRRLAALRKRKKLSNDELREQIALYRELADIRQKREALKDKNEPGRQQQAFIGELSGILGSFASNVGTGRAGAAVNNITINNPTPKTNHAMLREARLAAAHVF